MMGWYSGMGVGDWLLMGGFWVLLVALVAGLVVRLLPTGTRTEPGPATPSPVDALDARFARGELDESEYAAARTALTAVGGNSR